MEDSETAYSLPEGFNPWMALDAIRGLSNGIHHVLNDGAGTQEQMAYGDRAALDGLVELLREQVHALHDYFTHVSDVTTLKLPRTAADFEALHVRHARKDEVREPAAVYSIR